jgi:hypothetical protein
MFEVRRQVRQRRCLLLVYPDYAYAYGHEHDELNDVCDDDGGDVAVTEAFLIVQEMGKPKSKQTQVNRRYV